MSTLDRRILRSQQAIKRAFIELMSEKNFDHITIQDIADRANVNRRTIYLHYMDKFDLLDNLIEEHINKLREMCESVSETDELNGSVSWFKYFDMIQLVRHLNLVQQNYVMYFIFIFLIHILKIILLTYLKIL